MQRFGGLLFLLASTAALGGYLSLPPPPDDAADLAEITRISVAPYHPERSAQNAVRTFSPASPVFRDVVARDNSGRAAPRAAQASPVWTTVVTSEPSRTAVLRSAEPGDARTRFELARDLQSELKRAGCYGGEVNGVWTASTKRAMEAFMDRANARLPINAPDYILLSLVQNHADIACTDECPSGQAMSQSGRCVPNAVVAQASKRTRQPDAQRVADAAPTGDPPRGRTTEREQLPWLDRDGRSIIVQSAPRSAPPPGMMSVGGPGAGLPPPGSGALAQKVTIEPDDHIPLGAEADSGIAGAQNVAALGPEGAQQDGDVSAETADPNSLSAYKPEKHRRAKRARDYREKPRRYGYQGRSRRGQPRPGTMRYNVVQVLGGIY